MEMFAERHARTRAHCDRKQRKNQTLSLKEISVILNKDEIEFSYKLMMC